MTDSSTGVIVQNDKSFNLKTWLALLNQYEHLTKYIKKIIIICKDSTHIYIFIRLDAYTQRCTCKV